jgi:hypothetical protein
MALRVTYLKAVAMLKGLTKMRLGTRVVAVRSKMCLPVQDRIGNQAPVGIILQPDLDKPQAVSRPGIGAFPDLLRLRLLETCSYKILGLLEP